MKSVTINLAASWGAAIQSFVDGDVFRESNIDLEKASIADRLGYLKTAVDGAATLAGPNAFIGVNTFTGTNTFDTGTADLTIEGGGDVVLTGGGLLDVDHNAVFRAGSSALFEGQVDIAGYLGIDSTVGSDASGTIADGITCFRVPTLTGNRTYGLPAIVAGDNQILIFTRPRTADSYTAALSTIGTIPVSEAGWIVVIARAGTWVPLMWSSNVTGLSTAV